MKRIFYILTLMLLVATSCKDNDVSIFDQTADERTAEAISQLKSRLTAPIHGWRVKYRPENTSGSFWVLMQFDEEGTVTIKSDLGANDGEFGEQTVTYRIDSSLGLELIIESYSFFAYLFEQDQATFEAEYEFNYINETPGGQLVFQSKSDRTSNPTILLFEEAGADDEDLLGLQVAENLNTMADDIQRFSSSYKLVYQDKDLILYLSMDELRRTLDISIASKKTNTATTKAVNFSTPYIIEGDEIIFDEPLTGTYVGVSVSLSSIDLDDLTDASLVACGSPINIHSYSGVTSDNAAVALETTLLDANGRGFTSNEYMTAPIQNIFDNGFSQANKVAEDIKGAAGFQIYYDAEVGSGPNLYGIGFVIQNDDGSVTFALKEYTASFIDNNMIFTFEPGFRYFGNPVTEANVDNTLFYLNKLTEGDQTYVYEYAEGIYEFYNPCSGWSFVFLAPN
jgi:hypothetical protein